MTTYKRGDIVLVNFVFADEKGVKQRPALLASSARYHRSRREAILVAITSNVDRLLAGDHAVEEWQAAGLPLPSTVTGIVRTIKQDMIVKKLGELSPRDLGAVEEQLRSSLAL
jgi:mRNA-degrading endonuclease toxin of MazEF toxin-antitoxin module